jgi:hypothetical protein
MPASLAAGYELTSHAELKAGVVNGFPDPERPSFIPDWGSGVKPQCIDKRRGHAAYHRHPQGQINYQADSTIHLVMPQLTPQRDSKALAASSTASGSAFYDTRDPPSDGATVRGRDTGSQMLYTTDYRVRAADPISCNLC